MRQVHFTRIIAISLVIQRVKARTQASFDLDESSKFCCKLCWTDFRKTSNHFGYSKGGSENASKLRPQ